MVIFAVLFLLSASSIAIEPEKPQRLTLVYTDSALAHYVQDYLNRKLNGSALINAFSVTGLKLKQRLSSSSDLLVFLGLDAYQQAIQGRLQGHGVLLFVNSMEYERNVKHSQPGLSIAPIFMDQPVARMAKFSEIVLHGEKQFAFLLGPGSKSTKTIIRREFSKLGFRSTFKKLSDKESPMDSIVDILSFQSPIVALPDREVYTPSNTKWLLYKAHQAGIPVIGFSSAFIRAGAAAAIYTSVDQTLDQAAELVEVWRNQTGKKFTSSRKQYFPKYYSVEFNDSVYRSLNADHPDIASTIRELREGGKVAASHK